MSKLELTKEEARELLWGDLEGYKVVENDITSHSRWDIYYTIVVQRISDGKYFQDTYSVGATEYQEERPWDSSDPNFIEVVPVEKIVIEYIPIEKIR